MSRSGTPTQLAPEFTEPLLGVGFYEAPHPHANDIAIQIGLPHVTSCSLLLGARWPCLPSPVSISQAERTEELRARAGYLLYTTAVGK